MCCSSCGPSRSLAESAAAALQATVMQGRQLIRRHKYYQSDITARDSKECTGSIRLLHDKGRTVEARVYVFAAGMADAM
jgi:hypothetical protein